MQLKISVNLHVNHVAAAMDGATFLRVRNAAFVTRDISIRYDTPKTRMAFPKSRVEMLGNESIRFKSGNTIILKAMKPGENRWISFHFEAVKAANEFEMPVNFYEVEGNHVLNGCTVLLKASSLDTIIKSTLQLQYSVFRRVSAISNHKIDEKTLELNLRLLKETRFTEAYLKEGYIFYKALSIICLELTRKEDIKLFNFDNELKVLNGSISADNQESTFSA